MPLTRGQQIFRDVLAQELGLSHSRRAIGAWLFAEEGGEGGPASGYDRKKYFNYLNIGNTDSGRRDHDPSWNKDPATAARVTAQWIKGKGPVTRSYGKAAPKIRDLVNARSQDDFISRLSGSGWASSGYEGGSTLRDLLKQSQGGAKDAAGGAAAVATDGGAATKRAAASGLLTSSSSASAGANSSEQLLSLIAELGAKEKPVIQSAGLQAPAFAAGPRTPGGYAALSGGGAPVARGQDTSALLAALQTPAGGSAPATVRGAAAADSGGAGAQPAAPRAGRPSRTAGSSGMSPLFELFWQGDGGVDVKNGKLVPQGFVSGHEDHVHLAAGPKTTRELGRLAQSKFGLHVGENAAFGGVNPVHVNGSYHYRDRAIDVSGDAAKMRAFAHYVAQRYGIKT